MATDTEIAQHLKMSSRWVRQLRAEGVLPPAGSDLDTCRKAYFEHMGRLAEAKRTAEGGQTAVDTEKARYVREQADRVALKNAATRAAMAPREELRAALEEMIQVARTRLLRVAGDVCPDDKTLRASLARAIKDALVDLDAERAFVSKA